MNRPSIFCIDNGSYNGCNQGCCWSTSTRLLLALFPRWKPSMLISFPHCSLLNTFQLYFNVNLFCVQHLLISNLLRFMRMSQEKLSVTERTMLSRKDTRAFQVVILHVSTFEVSLFLLVLSSAIFRTRIGNIIML